jgi:hypothetical protein
MGSEAVRFLVLWMAGWIHSRQLEVIEFLREENRVLREQLGGRRLRFTEDQQRRLAVKGRSIGRRRLGELAGLVTPDTLNSIAERFVLSTKSECLRKLVLLGENHLRRAVSPNRRCDQPTGTPRSSAASDWADCSTSTIYYRCAA